MSGKSYFLIERKTRKQKLIALIEKHQGIELGKLKGLFSLQTGVSFKKIDEYLLELEESGQIQVAENGSYELVKP